MTQVTTQPNATTGKAADQDILARGNAILEVEAKAILAARDKLGEPFVQAVQAILSCTGRVCVTGMGKAGLIGAKIQATMASTGTLAYSLHPVDALHGDIGMLHPADIVLALSKSGSSELATLLPKLKAMGCCVILITAKPKSGAAQSADIILEIGDTGEACPLNLAPSSSTTAMLAMGDALALTVMEMKDIRAEQYARFHPGGELGRFLMKAHEVMRTDEHCPRVLTSATISQCWEAIQAAPRRAGAAAVVSESGRLEGIITHGDFFRLFKDRLISVDTSVSSVMTANPKHIRHDQRVTEAIELMSRHRIDDLPVVDDAHQLVGMLDVQDLLARGFSRPESSPAS